MEHPWIGEAIVLENLTLTGVIAVEVHDQGDAQHAACVGDRNAGGTVLRQDDRRANVPERMDEGGRDLVLVAHPRQHARKLSHRAGGPRLTQKGAAVDTRGKAIDHRRPARQAFGLRPEKRLGNAAHVGLYDADRRAVPSQLRFTEVAAAVTCLVG